MDSFKTPWARACVAVALTAITVVVIRARMQASQDAAWDRLAQARVGGFTAEKLEDVRREVEGTSAEPWAAYRLAVLLYEDGKDANRARQIAEAALLANPDHATAPMLSHLIEAIDSFQPGA